MIVHLCVDPMHVALGSVRGSSWRQWKTDGGFSRMTLYSCYARAMLSGHGRQLVDFSFLFHSTFVRQRYATSIGCGCQDSAAAPYLPKKAMDVSVADHKPLAAKSPVLEKSHPLCARRVGNLVAFCFGAAFGSGCNSQRFQLVPSCGLVCSQYISSWKYVSSTVDWGDSS
jgi:hypothetical protein